MPAEALTRLRPQQRLTAGGESRCCSAARRAGLRLRALRTRGRVAHVTCAADAGRGSRSFDLGALRSSRANRPQPAQRARPQPAPRQYSGPRATPEQVQLNRDIVACESADAVLDLVASSLTVLNGVNASTALVRLARYAGKRAAWLQGDPRLAQLLNAAERLFAAMGTQNLANALYACGKLGLVLPPEWLKRYWEASEPKLGEFNEQELSNTMYACGQLGITPPTAWLERYWDVSALKFRNFVPQGLSNTLYACGQLGLALPPVWLKRYWEAHALMLAECEPQDLSNTLYASGQLAITPPADWLLGFWHASAMKLGEFKPQELSNTLYACGQLGLVLPPVWLQRYWDASEQKLDAFVPQGLSNTLYACGQLVIKPSEQWLKRFWEASITKLGEFKPQELSNTLYACGQLDISPPADWLKCFWDASASKLGGFVPQGLSNTLSACAQLDARPPAGWLQSFCDLFERLLAEANCQNLANTALALATLGLWELPLWRGLWKRLCSSLPLDIASWNAQDHLNVQQLYQTYRVAEVERPGLLSAPDPALLPAARKSWIANAQLRLNEGRSRLHDHVSACLTRMGVAHANERWCERAERSIDIAIEGAGARVAVEVDGPTHFLQDGRQDGSTLLRNRMLAAHGWRVAVVDYSVWQEQLKSHALREDYLRRLLA